MADDTNTDDNTVFDDIADAIPGSFDDGLLQKAEEMVDKATDSLPGGLGDKVDEMINNLSADELIEKAKGLNPLDNGDAKK